MSERCAARVSDARVHYWQCTRKAVVTRKGNPYCHQHDPEFIAQKRAAVEAKYVAKKKADLAVCRSAKKLVRALGCGSPHWSIGYYGTGGRYTGGVVLDADEAKALVQRLQKLTVGA